MPRVKRQGLNQSVLRDVNERVALLAERYGNLVDDSWEFYCECVVIGCRATVRATIPEYDRVRAHPSTFLVAPGHQAEDREEVVYRADQYLVVRVVADEPASAGFS